MFRRLALLTAFACCVSWAQAQQLNDRSSQKADRTVPPDIRMVCSSPVVTPLNHPDPAAMAYLQHCFDLAARHNSIILGRPAYVIAWDQTNHIIAGYASIDEALEEEKAGKAEFYIKGDPGFDEAYKELERLESQQINAWNYPEH